MGLALLVGQCRSCSKKEESGQKQIVDAAQVVAQAKRRDALTLEIQSFLREYAPSLAVKREETVRAIEEARRTSNKLSAVISKYPTEEAKAIFREKVARYDRMIRSLNKVLTTIDHEATTALANREAREIEGGGIVGMDSEALIDSAESILRQAALLKSDSDSPPGDSEDTIKKPSLPVDQKTVAEQSLPASPSPDDNHFEKTLRQAEELAERVKEAIEAGKDLAPDGPEDTNPSSIPPLTTGRPTTPKTKPIGKPPTPPINQAAVVNEIRRLDASIATHEANLERAQARVNQITKNYTIPVVRGSRQHMEIQAIEHATQLSKSQLPGLKNQRDELKAKLGKQ